MNCEAEPNQNSAGPLGRHMYTIMIQGIQLSGNFHAWKNCFANSEEYFRDGSQHAVTWTDFAIKTLYQDLYIDHQLYVIIWRFDRYWSIAMPIFWSRSCMRNSENTRITKKISTKHLRARGHLVFHITRESLHMLAYKPHEYYKYKML